MRIASLSSAATLLALHCVAAPVALAEKPSRYAAQVVNPDLTGVVTLPGGIMLAYGTDSTVLRTRDGLTWEHAETPGHTDLSRIAAGDHGTQIAVGHGATLLRSTDAGRTWRAVRMPSIESDLRAVVHLRGTRTWLAAGTRGRILRSTDDGRQWTIVESHRDSEFLVLHEDPPSGTVLLGGADGTIGLSTDGGISWWLTTISMPAPVTPVTGFHRVDKLLLATSARGRFLLSQDDGLTWDLLQAGSDAFFTGVAHDPANGSIVMSGHNGDVIRSLDGGRTWQGSEVVVDGRKAFLNGIGYHAASRTLLSVGPGGIVVHSDDGGAHWRQASDSLRGDLRGLLITDGGALVTYGAGGMLARSEDGGRRWRVMREPLDLQLREIAPSPDGSSLVATGRLGEILRSVDAGASWQRALLPYPNPHTPPDLRAVVLAPSGDALIAAGPPGAILRSNADGTRWEMRHWTDLEAERALPWLLVNRREQTVVAVEARGGLLLSRDAGKNWSQRQIPAPPGFVFWQGTTLEREGVMIIAGKGGHAARSTNAGETWATVSTGTREDLFGSHADEGEALLFLMGAAGTLVRSGDGGVSWQSVRTGTTEELRRMMRDARSGALLCAGTHGTMLRSIDHGLHWSAVPTGVDGVLRAWLSEPRSGHPLVVGSRGALLRSTNGGRTWERLDTHTLRHFQALAADSRTGDLVLVGERIVRLVRQSGR
jgi:photosystem II stability/assembly factor-like uncharacterized protein